MLTAICLENSTLLPERSTDRRMQRHTAPLRSKDGTTLIKDKEGILCRWKEHFTDLLNRDSHVESDSIDNVPAVPIREELHTCQPSRIRRDSPAFSSDVPRSREISRCPAFFENGIIIFFVADYSTCLPRNATK